LENGIFVTKKHTPMMEQYFDLKEKHQDCLLFYRMGDFYELFCDDAIKAASILDITLTKRGKDDEGEGIPMCGVPVHAYEAYLIKLIASGLKIAVCEQMESPEDAKKRGHKGPLKRDVVRIITPGTITEETLLNKRKNNFIVSLSLPFKDSITAAYVDISTQEFFVELLPIDTMQNMIDRLNPSELLIPDILLENGVYPFLYQQYRSILNPVPKARFNTQTNTQKLCEQYNVKVLDAFGLSESAIQASGILIDYIATTQKKALTYFPRPTLINTDQFLHLDASTRRSLEIIRTQQGVTKGSLLSHMDATKTAAGGRLLYQRLLNPLQNIKILNQRYDQIDYFLHHHDCVTSLEDTLKKVPDLERCLGRLSLSRALPRDLSAVRETLRQSYHLIALLKNDAPFHTLPKIYAKLLVLKNILEDAIEENIPVYIEDGYFIKAGYNEELDKARYTAQNAQQLMKGLEEQYIKETQIQNLRIRYNKLIGYYIEVTPSHLSKVPNYFQQKQKISTSTRFTTDQLLILESEITQASHKIIKLESDLFNDLCAKILESYYDLLVLSQEISVVDVALSLAALSKKYKYVRPELIDDSSVFDIKKARHPVVEASLKDPFHANDCDHNKDTSFLLLTGPNMAGKSTYLRQNALIVLMAQVGCFVPAEKARFGIVDRLFSRVGASDDITQGQSTFMVEMIETATILQQATPKSFVILDEIGRGTATYDGVSIAWAVSEYLHLKKCRTIFATHYHELNDLENQLKGLTCLTMKIKEWEDKIIFLHEVAFGAANQSFGIHVAQLAGLPTPVLARAEEILQQFQKDEKDKPKIAVKKKKGLFQENNVIYKPSVVEQLLKEQNLDRLSPKQALDLLYVMHEKMGK
jgi:DNA mismatch repair protein MutS